MTEIDQTLRTFLHESNRIEGISREPDAHEITAAQQFMQLNAVHVDALCTLQRAFAPREGMGLRVKPGMDVRIGRHTPPSGGPKILIDLDKICGVYCQEREALSPFDAHRKFEDLHPFMDGNGRTGRVLWAWHMTACRQNPFVMSFLHRWYYQSLASYNQQWNADRRAVPTSL